MSDTSGWGPSGPYGGPPGGWGWAPPPPPPKPGVIPLAPLGVDTVFGGAFATMRRYGRPLFGLAVLAHLALGVLIAGAAGLAYVAVADHLHTIYDTPRGVHWTDVRPVVVAFVAMWAFGMVATLVTNALIQASCAATLHDAVLGRRVTLAQVWRRTLPRTPSVLGVTLLMGLIVLIPMLLITLAFFGLFLAALYRTSLPFGLFFLLALLMVPITVWLYVLFSFAPATAVLEAARPVQAMRRSVRLIRGAWWRTFGITLLGGLTVLVVTLAIRIPLMFAAPSPKPYDASTPPPTDMADALAQTLPDLGISLALSVAGSLLTQLFAMVFLPLITALLYIDQRIRREGLADMLLRASGS
ncbi:hypothetical protein GCM10011579_041740 [Streptomyces albiflavescens]|uniref:DUF7847 domain-containing protein n=1 Tax=Streptomyces albiflavescens TaxID=1623582 RepID=A0A917Y7G3_9ACTN|nr:oxidoreductase [Streptomyces albiflavescens]GGN68339.1 hypothetical protein GCM10011579_041740 [Streptomyces albiflavescens]